MTANSEGFLLLTIPGCHLTGLRVDEHGLFSLECVTLDVPASSTTSSVGTTTDRDVWLILRINSFEMPVSPLIPIKRSRILNSFTFSDSDDTVTLSMPATSDLSSADDVETFQVLLEQYGILHEIDPKESDAFDQVERKQLILVDEQDGHVIGSLGQGYKIHEEKGIADKGRENDPVIIDIPEQDDEELVVHSVASDETDTILRAAGALSRGIMYATSAISSGMSSAADYYISRSVRTESPVHFSESTRGHIKRAHKLSGQAVQVTAKTTGLIHQCLDSVIQPIATTPDKRSVSTDHLPSTIPIAAPQLPGQHAQVTPSPEPLPQSPEKPQSRLLNRLLLSTDLLLTTLEASTTGLLDSGTENLSRGLDHRYGPDVGNATLLMGRSARNVGVVYVDALGVGRRALLRQAGKGIIKGMVGNNHVVFDSNGSIGSSVLIHSPASAIEKRASSSDGK